MGEMIKLGDIIVEDENGYILLSGNKLKKKKG